MRFNRLRIYFMFLLVLTIPLSISLVAQEKDTPKFGWKNEIVGNLNFTQSSFSNWSQGGEDSWNWQLDLNGKFENDQPKYNWATTGKISYGKTKISGEKSKKTTDEVHLESVFTYKVGLYVNPYVAVTGETQLTEGFDFSTDPQIKISTFLDPGYFTESLGLGYEPIKDFKTRLGAALKQTVADQFAARYTDDPATLNNVEKVRSEIGMESVTDYSRKLSENIVFTTKLELFSNLKGIDEVDVRWDNLFAAKVSKYIAVSFNMKLFYDKDISVQRQLKQVLAAGLTYTFL